MRASRLLSIMLLLHARGRVSAQQLAAEFEISLRTVYRDMQALSTSGVPIYATRGRSGGFQLIEGYRSRVTGLTPDEVDALLFAGLPATAADLGLGEVLAASQVKLMASLSPQARVRAGRIRDRFHLDTAGWERRAESPALLPEVADAVWAQHRLAVRYERSDHSVVDRVLEPLGLVLKAGAWYIVAMSSNSAPRTYRLSRIRSTQMRDESFGRPDGFELDRHWAAYQHDYESRLFHDEATIRLSAAGRRMLFMIGSLAAKAGHAAMQPAEPDGTAVTTIPIESIEHGCRALLQLGTDVEVLEPAALRAAVQREATALLAHYEPLRTDLATQHCPTSAHRSPSAP